MLIFSVPICCLPFLAFRQIFNSFREFSEERSVNYEVDHSVGSHERYDKRRQLTADFGSAKKIKMQDAAQRRHIGDVHFYGSLSMHTTYFSKLWTR